MTPACDTCIIIPAFNEQSTLLATLKAVQEANPDACIAVVDNASTDGTHQIALDFGAVVLTESRAGKGYAVATGMQWALTYGAFRVLALHDADNEYCAKDLAALLSAVRAAQETHTHVMGVGLREVTLAQVHWRSLLANWVARKALGLSVRKAAPLDILSGTRAFTADCARVLFMNPTQRTRPLKGFELETALTRRAMKSGAHMVFVPIRYTPRALQEKKIRALDMLPILKAAWTA